MYYDFHTASAAVVVYLADDTGEQQREIAVFPIHNGNVTEAEELATRLMDMLNEGLVPDPYPDYDDQGNLRPGIDH